MPNHTLNTTELMTGKDGRLFVEVDNVPYFLAEVDTFAVNMNVNTTQVQPVGSILQQDVVTGVTFELTFTEMVIRDNLTIAPLLKELKKGKVPVYTFSGVLERGDGHSQRYGFNDAVPKGSLNIMNVVPNEVVKRSHTFALNSIPEILSELASAYQYE